MKGTAICKIKTGSNLESPYSKEGLKKLVLCETEKFDLVKSSSQMHNVRLKLPTTEQHYWSPLMNLSFEWDEYDNKLYIRGVIRPNDRVWIMFMFFYIGTIMLGLFGVIWVLTKWQVSDDLSLILIIPLSIFIFGSIFSTVKYGTLKAHTQMLHLLRFFLRKVLDSLECERCDD